MEKFRIDFRTSIEKFTIVKDLRTQVIYLKNDTYFHTGEPFTREIKENKISNYACWFDTFEEAKQHLILHYNEEIHFHSNCIKSNVEKLKATMNLIPNKNG